MTCIHSFANPFERGMQPPARAVATSERDSQRLFIGVSALLFLVSAGVTVVWCGSMSAMPGMSMQGGWTMSMAWMRMPGQSWIGAGGTFVAMWVVMMAAMMLPSLSAMLWRYRRALRRRRQSGLGLLTAIAGAAYFFVWALCGVGVFLGGAGIASTAMQWPALAKIVPMAAGLVVLGAGAFQFTKWKDRHLASCREEPMRGAPAADPGSAWRHGLRLGMRCGVSCANLTAILLVAGVMDLRTMAMVTVAITAERIAPGGARIARIVGAIAMSAGVLVFAGVVRL
ncbi:MAG TPA: DUF2182 domain-containing protein, partial [Acidobacteriaceae bacterium]|nr:DUF2182 domain-containing protein [Acidobacteriaceae bacterium]